MMIHLVPLLFQVWAVFSATLTNPVVREVRIECDADYAREEAERAITIQPGARASPSAIQKSLRNLALLHQFSSVEAIQEEVPGGVAITFRTTRQWLIRRIRITRKTTWKDMLRHPGLSAPKSQVRTESGLYPMQPLVEEVITNAQKRVREFLLRRGFPEARIDIDIDRDEQTRMADIRILIWEGTPYLVDTITFSGNPRLRPEVLKRAMRTKEGYPFAKDRLDQDRELLRQCYKFYGINMASIPRPAVSADVGQRSVSIMFSIEAPAPDRLTLTCPLHLWNWAWIFNRIDRSRLADALELPDGPIDDDVITAASSTLRQHYQARGFALAEVTAHERFDATGTRHVNFQVTEGEKIVIASITFDGNRSLSPEELAAQMLSAPGRRFSIAELDQDKAAILTLYRSKGYGDAQIIAHDAQISSAARVSVIIHINEGAQQQLRAVEILGNQRVPAETLREKIAAQPGHPYDPARLEEDRVRLQSYYELNGYPHAITKLETVDGPEPHTKIARFVIEEGVSVVFDKVLFRGYLRTKRRVLARANRIRPGAPFSQQAILDSQRQIAALGLFQAVRMDPLEAEQGQSERTVVLSVTEANNSYIDAGVGYNTSDGWRFLLDGGTRNLGGFNRSLSGTVLISQVEERISARFREPYITGLRLDFTGELFQEMAFKDGYTVSRLGGTASLRRSFSRRLRLLLEYRLESQSLDFDQGRVAVDEDDRGRQRVAALGPLLMYDSRDDPRNPNRGVLASLRAETARTVFGSEVDFPKTIGQFSVLLPLQKSSVLALSLRAGVARNLPLAESFAAGGMKTVRGYAYESIRPRQSVWDLANGREIEMDLPANSLLILNGEFRFPTLWDLQSVLFVDSGNAWEQVSEMDIGDLRSSAGFGLRYLAPFGPVGFDLAFKIHPEPGERRSRVEFMIGHAF